MGEYPPLSDEEIKEIHLASLKLESGRIMDGATLFAEFPDAHTGT